MDLTLHEGLTKILLNSSRDLNRIYSGAFRCAEEEICCFPSSQGWGQAVELTAVLEATGLRIQSIALGGTLWKWLEGFGNTSLRCQLLRRFILRCWFAAPTPRVYPGSQLRKLFPNSRRSLFTQHRQINSTVTLTHNCLLLICPTWHVTKGYYGNLSYNLALLYCFKSLTLQTFNFGVLFKLPYFISWGSNSLSFLGSVWKKRG